MHPQLLLLLTVLQEMSGGQGWVGTDAPAPPCCLSCQDCGASGDTHRRRCSLGGVWEPARVLCAGEKRPG